MQNIPGLNTVQEKVNCSEPSICKMEESAISYVKHEKERT